MRSDWIQTASGKAFYPLAPVPADICAEDIAHALAMLCRFNGHCRRFYSVAEHSVLMARTLPRPLKLWALLHDAAEAYLADVPRPVKPELLGYRDIEDSLAARIFERFGLCGTVPDAIAKADLQMLAAEKEQNMAPPPHPWATDCEPAPVRLRYWGPARAKREFLSALASATRNKLSPP